MPGLVLAEAIDKTAVVSFVIDAIYAPGARPHSAPDLLLTPIPTSSPAVEGTTRLVFAAVVHPATSNALS